VQVDEATCKVPDGHVSKAVWVIDRADSAGQPAAYDNRPLPQPPRAAWRFQGAGTCRGGSARFGVDVAALRLSLRRTVRRQANPSKRLKEELVANHVQLVLCGQTAGFRGVKRDELFPGVQLAISAMTALNVFQAQGYQFNPW
ncbi:MAG: DsrE family protein, partial [Gammaproteobacteria bacterium]